MTGLPVSLDDIKAAAALLDGEIQRTPMLPAPRLSLRGVFTSIRKWFQKLTGAVMVEDTATTPEGADALRIAAHHCSPAC